VNYRTNPNWEQEVRKLTGDVGVHQVLEVGGKDTLPKATASLAYGGHIALIGGLTGFDGQIPAGALTGRSASVTGIYVGSRADFEAMNEFMAKHRLKPVIDRVFAFEDAPAAFAYMDSGDHFGKVVIRL
jgi:NADPH:quinone reductase-like Zn-dependent oxidoreductase